MGVASASGTGHVTAVVFQIHAGGSLTADAVIAYDVIAIPRRPTGPVYHQRQAGAQRSSLCACI